MIFNVSVLIIIGSFICKTYKQFVKKFNLFVRRNYENYI